MNYRQAREDELSEGDVERMELLKRSFIDPDQKKPFRTAYCFKAYNFSSLKPYCEDIVVAIDGYGDHIDKIRAKLERMLKDYDPDKDLIVPVGRATDNVLVGQIVAQKVALKPKIQQSYVMGIYLDWSYKFYQIHLDPSIESYELMLNI